VGSRLALVAGLLLLLLSVSSALAQAPVPVLRGIVLTHSGEGRAYFEDPRTGAMAPYAVGDVVGDNRIEEIQDEYVVLRRGDQVVRVSMGSAPSPLTSEAAPAPVEPPRSSAPAPTVYRPNPTGGPTIGSGQAWLDRLGIPPQALSRAIEEALPPQDPELDNIKD
jgi:hypothetical protein